MGSSGPDGMWLSQPSHAHRRASGNCSLDDEEVTCRKRPLITSSRPFPRLVATHSNRCVKEVLKTNWTNMGVVSAFIGAISFSMMIAAAGHELSLEDSASKHLARKVIVTMNAISSVLLLLSVILITSNLATLMVCPESGVDMLVADLEFHRILPAGLLTVSTVLLVSSVGGYTFAHFGHCKKMYFILTAMLAFIVF